MLPPIHVPPCALLLNYRTSYAGEEYLNKHRGKFLGCGKRCAYGDTFLHPTGPSCRVKKGATYESSSLKPCDIPLYDGSMIKAKARGGNS